MDIQKNSLERRKDNRYEVQEEIFAAVPSNYLIGQVKNISRGGLAFAYIDLKDQIVNRPVMDIFSKDNYFYLKEITLKVVSEMDIENRVPCSSVSMKQICGEFAELTEYQKSRLDIFLQNLNATEAVC